MVYGDRPITVTAMLLHNKFHGVILNNDISKIYEVDLRKDDEVQEFINHSWYEYKGGDKVGLHPWKGESKVKYSGPKPPFEFLDTTQKYSYLKTPRWKGNAMEVGPLARLLVAYGRGNKEVKEIVDKALTDLQVPVTHYSQHWEEPLRGVLKAYLPQDGDSNFTIA
jgi:hydrogenase large subunit